ncbi:MAG: putative anaerobic reductase component, partial [Verrucomicrobiales bacterium]|nr:putative anaerobic reductase component [Verrucomicrobiales bacterium]
MIDQLLAEQRTLTAVAQFAKWHDVPRMPMPAQRYRNLIPVTLPKPGEQLAFEVELDKCSGCKACVTACHNLNQLDENETWRSVGFLHGGNAFKPLQANVTTACHHCVDPACLNGCPVLAYEKDSITGIVRHLGDRCMGCQYCILKCPYEVPQFRKDRGIVRKCDMCSSRLANNEAPACVQSCPNEAIRIVIVDKKVVAATTTTETELVPGAPKSE